MKQTNHNLNQNIELDFNFRITSAGHLETDHSPEQTLVITDKHSNLMMGTACDPDAVASFLGLEFEGHFTPSVIFEFFSVPLTDLQAVLLVSLFVGLERTGLTTDELYNEWADCSFDSRFAVGYGALEVIMDEWGFEMPPTLKNLNEDSAAVQSALETITSMMKQIDGPLNKALEARPDLENAEGFFVEVDFTPDEEEDEEVPF